MLLCCTLLLGTAIVAVAIHRLSLAEHKAHPTALFDLLALPPASLAGLSIVELNLLCARGLCPANEPDLQACAATLDIWAAHVRSETERHQYRFERSPAEFEKSEGYFHMLMLCVVLTEDYGIHYDERRRAGPAETTSEDGFFSDPSAVFLNGLLGPERKGTCSSLPVLYVAVGRRLGYPLRLVTTRGHLFVRWDGQGERFNVEATAHGLSRFNDDYYRHWPFEITSMEEAAEGYLKSLTPSEELAVFLSTRAMCLREQGRLSEAEESLAAAARLAPGCRSYRLMLESVRTALQSPKETTGLTLTTTGQSARE